MDVLLRKNGRFSAGLNKVETLQNHIVEKKKKNYMIYGKSFAYRIR